MQPIRTSKRNIILIVSIRLLLRCNTEKNILTINWFFSHWPVIFLSCKSIETIDKLWWFTVMWVFQRSNWHVRVIFCLSRSGIPGYNIRCCFNKKADLNISKTLYYYRHQTSFCSLPKFLVASDSKKTTHHLRLCSISYALNTDLDCDWSPATVSNTSRVQIKLISTITLIASFFGLKRIMTVNYATCHILYVTYFE